MSDASEPQWNPWEDQSIAQAVERAGSVYALIEKSKKDPTQFFSEHERQSLIPKLDGYLTYCVEQAYLDVGAWQDHAVWEKLRSAIA